MRVLELLKTWEKSVGVECWSCWTSTVEEVLKFRFFFVTKKKRKKRRGVECRRGCCYNVAGPSPARRRGPSLATGLRRAAVGSWSFFFFFFGIQFYSNFVHFVVNRTFLLCFF